MERLVVAGGDGTTSEVVTGLLGAGLGERVEIGLLPLGSGCDFARGLGLAREPGAAIENLADKVYSNHLNSPNPFNGRRILEIGRAARLGVELRF